jgi:cytochrome c oxidase subunit II
VRKGLIIQLVVLGVIIGALSTLVAIFIPWLPELGSEEGGRIDDVYWLTTIICLAIFALVAAASIYAVIKFRAKSDDDDEDGKPIHGHTGLEAFWTAVPAALVTVIAIYSGIVLVKNEELPANHRTIEVTAQQFAWSFTYPELGVTTGVLRVPVGEKLLLEMEAEDVIHSFWVPEWRVKQDVVPGTVQRYIVTPTKLGTFPLICTELCGLGHSTMRARVEVLSKADFAAWEQEQQGATSAGGAEQGEQVFETAGCGGCHILAAAGSTGEVGPDLDMVLPELSEEQIRESIVDPNAELAPGYQPDVMPQDYGDSLTPEQLDALVGFLVEAGEG